MTDGRPSPGSLSPPFWALLPKGFSIGVEEGDDTVVLHVQGELDMATADRLHRALSTVMDRRAAAIVVDVAGLTFVDSTGIAALLSAWRRATTEGQSLRLRHPTRLVGKVLRITGVDRVLLDGPGVDDNGPRTADGRPDSTEDTRRPSPRPG